MAADGSGVWSYCASKAGVDSLTKTLASSLSKYCITVNSIAPGVFPTKMTQFALNRNEQLLKSVQPLGRIGTESDIEGVVVFLVSKASAHINGVVLPVDGGFLVGGASKL